MHLAYSAISTIKSPERFRGTEIKNDQLLRYRAYKITCNKFSKEIAAIQKYIPGWLPCSPTT